MAQTTDLGATPASAANAFGWGKLLAAALAMAALVLGLHFLCLRFYPKAELDPWGYPLSVYKFRWPQAIQCWLALGFAQLFHVVWRRLGGGSARGLYVFLAALALTFASNLLHGWRYGIDYPTASIGTGGFEYYHDAILIKGPLWFLARFNAIQFELLEHARTHPPGPVLLYYFLHRLLGNPGLISLAVCALSLALALPYFGKLCRLLLGAEPPGARLLFAILPAFLVYGIAVVDVWIAALFLAALVESLDEASPRSPFLASLFLALAAFFTFGALFLLPVFAGFTLLCRRRLGRAALIVVGAASLLALLKPLTGFDWLSSFLRASAIENEKGFLLLANPRGYLWYRLGAIAEIAIYFTPFLCVLWWRGMRLLRPAHASAWVLAWLGPLVLLGMLLAGMLKIGEAARVCMFILPYLALPALVAFRELEERGRARVAQAVLGWGLGLQLFGFYQW